jgi:predicted kinase
MERFTTSATRVLFIAIIESLVNQKGTVLSALTVDRAGHDCLKTMCEDIGYEVVADIEVRLSRSLVLPINQVAMLSDS